MNISTESLGTIVKLRPPFARSALMLFPFTGEGRVNSGITVEMVVGEPAVAAGAGAVEKIISSFPQWQTNDEALRRTTVKHIIINHGNNVTTTVGGFTTVDVKPGQTVYRGDKLGDLYTNQLFFSVALGQKALNPLALNSHWLPQNGAVIAGQGGKIRFAPDRLVRDLSAGVTVVLHSGLKYFKQLLEPTPFLVNVAFNGDGSKVGLAATGIAATDYWNVYTPTDFLATASYACYYYYGYGSSGYFAFSAAPVLNLNNYAGTRSPAVLERVAPLFSAASGAASWDDMLKLWIGGYLGPIPYENTFRLRNIPAGVYNLYLYANQGVFPTASTFYVSVNAGLPTAQTNNPSVTPGFVEGVNYVKYSLTVPASGYVTIKTVGYMSGLQMQRT